MRKGNQFKENKENFCPEQENRFFTGSIVKPASAPVKKSGYSTAIKLDNRTIRTSIYIVSLPTVSQAEYRLAQMSFLSRKKREITFCKCFVFLSEETMIR